MKSNFSLCGQKNRGIIKLKVDNMMKLGNFQWPN